MCNYLEVTIQQYKHTDPGQDIVINNNVTIEDYMYTTVIGKWVFLIIQDLNTVWIMNENMCSSKTKWLASLSCGDIVT